MAAACVCLPSGGGGAPSSPPLPRSMDVDDHNAIISLLRRRRRRGGGTSAPAAGSARHVASRRPHQTSVHKQTKVAVPLPSTPINCTRAANCSIRRPRSRTSIESLPPPQAIKYLTCVRLSESSLGFWGNERTKESLILPFAHSVMRMRRHRRARGC